ncbi:Rox3-domain-containing protein [Microthyrium microscopicum]|uniref:Mediator of RNA polymerase II transcription subunit 19 n=1 Tax=Microthyrium microscopicum TaxID=703497 RepID=A0A6A6U6N3_9PEZI|nr:Rox3-domain-containing protein [Microthyrium microscopicum]
MDASSAIPKTDNSPMEGVIDDSNSAPLENNVHDYVANLVGDRNKKPAIDFQNPGPLLLSCNRPPIRPTLHPSQNFIELLGLSELEKKFRRTDPDTGEKLVKLRKSYEGKIKELKIGGRNKAPEAPEQFKRMLEIPEEHYVSMHVRGQEPEDIVGTPEWEQKLNRALQMLPGKLPTKEDTFYKNLISLEETAVPTKINKSAPISFDANRKANSGKQISQAESKLQRPERHGAKRNYDDASYVGYGDGGEDDGTGDERKLGRKKQKLNFSGNSVPSAGGFSRNRG